MSCCHACSTTFELLLHLIFLLSLLCRLSHCVPILRFPLPRRCRSLRDRKIDLCAYSATRHTLSQRFRMLHSELHCKVSSAHRPPLPTFAHNALASAPLPFFNGSELVFSPARLLPPETGVTLAERFLTSLFFATLTFLPATHRPTQVKLSIFRSDASLFNDCQPNCRAVSRLTYHPWSWLLSCSRLVVHSADNPRLLVNRPSF